MTEQDKQKEKEMEGHFKELRLAEHAFFREAFKNIKAKHRRYDLWLLFICAILLVLWSFYSCPWLHKIGLCPMSH